jgi:hypothetical protein
MAPPFPSDRGFRSADAAQAERPVAAAPSARAWRVFAAIAGVIWAALLLLAWRTLRDPATPPMGVAFMSFWMVSFAVSGPLAIYWLLASQARREGQAPPGPPGS